MFFAIYTYWFIGVNQSMDSFITIITLFILLEIIREIKKDRNDK